jgi:maleate cis-trans isomerase
MLGSRGMVGLIVPANNSVILPEIYRALPDGVTAYETRMNVEGDLTVEAVERMIADANDAATLLRQTGVDLICYCCMVSSVIKGWQWEDELLAQLAPNAARGATSANRAMLEALRYLGARTVALVTPYPAELNVLLDGFFAAKDVRVKSVGGVEVRDVKEVRRLKPEGLRAICRELDLEGVDALCLLATDMETLSVIDALERELDRPVLSSNQAIIWAILNRLELGTPLSGYGSLLGRGR